MALLTAVTLLCFVVADSAKCGQGACTPGNDETNLVQIARHLHPGSERSSKPAVTPGQTPVTFVATVGNKPWYFWFKHAYDKATDKDVVDHEDHEAFAEDWKSDHPWRDLDNHDIFSVDYAAGQPWQWRVADHPSEWRSAGAPWFGNAADADAVTAAALENGHNIQKEMLKKAGEHLRLPAFWKNWEVAAALPVDSDAPLGCGACRLFRGSAAELSHVQQQIEDAKEVNLARNDYRAAKEDEAKAVAKAWGENKKAGLTLAEIPASEESDDGEEDSDDEEEEDEEHDHDDHGEDDEGDEEEGDDEEEEE